MAHIGVVVCSRVAVGDEENKDRPTRKLDFLRRFSTVLLLRHKRIEGHAQLVGFGRHCGIACLQFAQCAFTTLGAHTQVVGKTQIGNCSYTLGMLKFSKASNKSNPALLCPFDTHAYLPSGQQVHPESSLCLILKASRSGKHRWSRSALQKFYSSEARSAHVDGNVAAPSERQDAESVRSLREVAERSEKKMSDLAVAVTYPASHQHGI